MMRPTLTVGCARVGPAARLSAAESMLRMAPPRGQGVRPSCLLIHPCLERVLDVLDLVELDVEKLAADLLNPAYVDGLHDVAGLGVDGYGAARTFPLHAFGGSDQGVAVGRARGLLQGLVDEVHAVVAADGVDIRVASGVLGV